MILSKPNSIPGFLGTVLPTRQNACNLGDFFKSQKLYNPQEQILILFELTAFEQSNRFNLVEHSGLSPSNCSLFPLGGSFFFKRFGSCLKVSFHF